MRFLCLHGIGTNNDIFKMQTAAFRYELGDGHQYEFVQGTIPYKLPAEMTAFANPDDKYFTYHIPESHESFTAAVDALETYILEEGPFDGAMAFSSGAGLVAMLLLRRHYLDTTAAPLFKCAILFSPPQVYNPKAYATKKAIEALKGLPPGMPALNVPMAIIYGDQEDTKEQSSHLRAIGDPKSTFVHVHQGGHAVPTATSKVGDLSMAVKLARRAITLAQTTVY